MMSMGDQRGDDDGSVRVGSEKCLRSGHTGVGTDQVPVTCNGIWHRAGAQKGKNEREREREREHLLAPQSSPLTFSLHFPCLFYLPLMCM